MQLTIPSNIWRRIMQYAQLASPKEITGIGLVELDPKTDDHYIVKDVFLPQQSANEVFSKFSETGLHDIITDVFTNDISDVTKLRFRWHSHGENNVFFSATDNADIEKWESDWVFNLVVNAKGEHCARFDQMRPTRVRYHPVELRIDYLDGPDRTAAEQELQRKVTFTQLPNPISPKGGGKLGYKGLF